LTKIAAGWFGWTEKVALNTDVNYIELAYQGRVDMLEFIFGKSDKADGIAKDAQGNPIVLTPDLFDTIVTPAETGQIRYKAIEK
jgi:hypothetical protein